MSLLEGLPISTGFASGTAVVYDYEIARRLEIPRRDVSFREIAAEHDRLEQAVEHSHGELTGGSNRTDFRSGSFDVDTLLAAHARMVNEVAAIVRRRVSEEFVNVEHALDAVISEFVERLSQLESDYFREREQDVRDVGRRMMRHLTGSLSMSDTQLPAESVIVARELLPSEAIEIAQTGVTAIVLEHGGRYGHTAILARALGIPAVTGIPDVTTKILPGEHVLVDGESGRVIVAPTRSEAEYFATQKSIYQESTAISEDDESLRCITEDGVEVALLANVGRPEEVSQVVAHHLDGVGLFRTEFVYLESYQRPSFEEQLAIYRGAAEQLGDRPLVIRTFDLGGDKLPPFLSIGESRQDPHSVLRGLRFSLAEKRLFDTQLRAVVQVAQEHNVRILLPMVIGSHDLSLAIAAIDEVIARCNADQRPLIGAMIETPAALFALDEILELVDFVSIGTNDLMQYMLATDRDVATSADDCTSLHPAILRAIRQVVDAAELRNCPVCVCGEEAGDVDFAYLLVGLGIRELSLSPGRGAEVRQAIRELNSQHAVEVAEQAIRCRSPGEVRELLQRLHANGVAADTYMHAASVGGYMND